MNRILLISLAIVFCVNTISYNLQKVTHEANEQRRERAKNTNISNINEIEYSKDLETALHPIAEICNYTRPLNPNYTYVIWSHTQKMAPKEFSEYALSSKFAIVEDPCEDGKANLLIIDRPEPDTDKIGVAGSACEAGRINKDGLCAKKEESTTESGGGGDEPTRITFRSEISGPDGTETTTSSISAMSVLMSMFTVIFAFFVN